MTDLVKRLRSQIAQLRHAYMQLAGQTVKRQKEFADGLVSPAIQEFEKAADEIEKLRLHLSLYRHHKTVLDDLREWLQRQGVETVMAEKWLDAYEKDKLNGQA